MDDNELYMICATDQDLDYIDAWFNWDDDFQIDDCPNHCNYILDLDDDDDYFI